MAAINVSDLVIRPAAPSDLAEVLEWLRRESDGEHGFWCNRDFITRAQAEGNLSALACPQDNLLVGFLVSSDWSMDIMEIKTEFRNLGLGRVLAEHGLRRIEQSGGFGVQIECMPRTSILF